MTEINLKISTKYISKILLKKNRIGNFDLGNVHSYTECFDII